MVDICFMLLTGGAGDSILPAGVKRQGQSAKRQGPSGKRQAASTLLNHLNFLGDNGRTHCL
jgi:hypothetical protein